MKILIIGAGPTGLTAALELARQGVFPDIVDAKDEPSKMSRAVGVLPKSIDILNRTGVGEKILKEGVKIQKVRIHRGDTALVDLDMSQYLENHDLLIGLPQDRTESLMSERLEEMGVSVQYGVKVERVTTSADKAQAIFEDGSTKEYDWIIGADGVFSTVRESLGIEFKGYELEEEWSIADVEIEGEFKKNTVQAWLLESDRGERDALVMVPITDNRVRLVSSTPDSMKALPIKLDVKKVRRSGTFKISVRQASEYVKGRVVLAGDAAHVHSPVGGRGMNLGIDDGQAVATAIISGDIVTYTKERMEESTGVIKGTEKARKLLVSDNPFTVGLIKIIAFFIQHVTFIQKKFVERVTSS